MTTEIKLISNLIEKTVNYTKACNKQSFLMTKQPCCKVNFGELKYSPLKTDVFESPSKTTISNLAKININEIKTKIGDINFVKRFKKSSEFYNKMIDDIYHCVTQGSQSDIKLINLRIKKLDKDFYSKYLFQDVKTNSGFLLDNLKTINKIRNNLSNCNEILFNIDDYIKLLSKDNINEVLSMSKKVKSGDKKAIEYFYKLRTPNLKIEHNVQEINIPYNPEEFKIAELKMHQATPEEVESIKKISLLIGKNAEEYKKVENSLQDLKNIIGLEEFSKINWNKLKNNEKPLSIDDLENMIESSKFFTRLDSLKGRNGINFQWANTVNEISKKTTVKIQQQENLDNILKYIAEKYRICCGGKIEIGQYRGNLVDYSMCVTGYGDRGFGRYKEYVQRFSNRKRIPPYKDMALTHLKVDEHLMVHPYRCEVDNNMKYANACYDELKALISKSQMHQLTQAESKHFDNLVAELYYIMANTMPFSRGTNCISDILMRSLYKSVGKELPALNKNVSLDLEAFCMPLDAYKSNWNKFFCK